MVRTCTIIGITLAVLCALITLHAVSATSCAICKQIVDQFKTGLDKTKKSNFGGGNTNWEEKSLGKWKTSETRLVEIVEHHICQGDDKKCHMFYENHEEALEDWYFNVYKDADTPDSLQEHLCVKATKVCCPDKTYGKDCTPCPSIDDGQVCGGHGICQGDGTRSGDGSCKCYPGFVGDTCQQCAYGYYEEVTDSIQNCLACDNSCKDTCTEAGPAGCDDCKEGYEMDDSLGCKDIDECASDEHKCSDEPSSYCINTAGSYSCKQCHRSCHMCADGLPNSCTQCKQGYEKTTTDDSDADHFSCSDVNECEAESVSCSHIANSKCVNTDGSYSCECEGDYTLQGDACLPPHTDSTEQSQGESQEADATSETENKVKGKTAKQHKQRQHSSSAKSKTNKKSKTQKTRQDTSVDNDSPAQSDNPSDKYTKNKRKYRPLDTMVLVSASSLYLVLCLVVRAETFKTCVATLTYALFVFQFSGQFL